MANKTLKKEQNPNKTEGNKFDKMLKENLEAMVPVLLRTALKMKLNRMENLPKIRQQITKEKEPDFLKKVFSDDFPTGFLLQIEFESKDEHKTDARILEYVAMEYLNHGLPVDVHLIYLPKGKPKNFKGKVQFFGLNFKYPVHVLSEIDYRDFLSSDNPEDVLMAIFADPKKQPVTEVLRLILEKLYRLRGDSSEILKFVHQLKMFSILRNLQPQTQKLINDMIDVSEFAKAVKSDNWYQMGEKQGLVQGLEQGLEQGREEGEVKKTIFGIRNMARLKFPADQIAGILGVEEKWVKMIQTQIQHEPEAVKLLKTKKLSSDEISEKLKIHPLLVKVIAEEMDGQKSKS